MPILVPARSRIEAFSVTGDDAMTETCPRKLLKARRHGRGMLCRASTIAAGSA